jgi:hypothetical protein
MHHRIGPHILIISWLALLLCLWTTGDLVIDLVFETPDVAVDSATSTEEPDNAAEHLLMSSPRADSLTASVVMAAPSIHVAADFIAITDHAQATPTLHGPPRNRPLSSPPPLRI